MDPFGELERPGAAGNGADVAAGLFSGVLADDADGGQRQVGQQRDEGVEGLELDRVFIHGAGVFDVYAVDEGADLRVLQGALKGINDVGGGQRVAVVELHVLPQLEHEGRVVGELPALGEAGADVHLLVLDEQRVIELADGQARGAVVLVGGVKRDGLGRDRDQELVLFATGGVLRPAAAEAHEAQRGGQHKGQ